MTEYSRNGLNGSVEHRRRIRHRVELEPQITVIDRRMDKSLGYLHDINDMGIRVTSKNPITVHRFMKIRLDLPYPVQSKQVIFFDALSVWDRFNEKTSEYSTGMQMLNVSPEDRRTIQQLIVEYPLRQINAQVEPLLPD